MISQQDILILARKYHSAYKELGDVYSAMEKVLNEANVPQGIRGTVSEKIKNFKSVTMVTVDQMNAPVSLRKKLRFVGKTFAQESLPNGDRD